MGALCQSSLNAVREAEGGSGEGSPTTARVRRGRIGWSLLLVTFLCAPAVEAPAVVTVELSAASARPGETIEISAVLTRDAGEEVAAVQMDLTFDADTLSIAAGSDGRPDCRVEPGIDKSASGFGFGPSGCGSERRPCSRVRAVVVATDNVDPIAEGAVLYRCRVDVAFDAPMGRQVIRGRRALYSDPSGRERTAFPTDAPISVAGSPLDTPTPAPTVTPRDTPTKASSGSGGGCQLHTRTSSGGGRFWSALVAGIVWLLRNSPSLSKRGGQGVSLVALLFATSPASAAVSVDIGSAGGLPGETVVIDVQLTADEGEEVAGTQNDLRFDPAIAAVVPLEDGTPDCAVNLNINKLATAFGFRPRQCDPLLGECSAVRAIVLAFDNVDPIADGSVLYSCRFAIAPNAPAGEYELANTRTGYSPPPGGDRSAAGRPGVIMVHAAPTATPRPTEMTPAPTVTTGTPQPTTPVAHDPGDTNCDGTLDRDDLRAVVASIFTRAEVCNADCNRDGEVSGPDLVCVTHRHTLAAGGGSEAVDRFRRPGRSTTRRSRTR